MPREGILVRNPYERITGDQVLQIHRALTVDTLPKQTVGRLQSPDDERVSVVSNTTGEVLHSPPPAGQLRERLERMCRFANGEDEKEFLHPVVRAILLHLWLG